MLNGLLRLEANRSLLAHLSATGTASSTLQLDPQLDLAALLVRLAQDRWIVQACAGTIHYE